MALVWDQEVRGDVAAAITASSRSHGVPLGLAFALSKFESGFNPAAVGDAGCSYGLYQLNICGGVGTGHDRDLLLDPSYNAEVALAKLRLEYEAHGNWWDAAWPWSVRPLAFAWWEGRGDPFEVSTVSTIPWLALGLITMALLFGRRMFK